MKKLTLLLAATLIAAPTAYAAGGGNDGHQRGGNQKGKGEMRMMRQLDLTDEQQTQIKDIMEAKKEQRQAQSKDFSQRQANQAQHMAIVSSVTFDEDAAKAMIDAQLEKQSERRLDGLKTQHEIFQILTPEQQTKYQELQTERMEKMQDKMEKRQGKRMDGKGKSSN